jgi:hypothetical protein
MTSLYVRTIDDVLVEAVDRSEETRINFRSRSVNDDRTTEPLGASAADFLMISLCVRMIDDALAETVDRSDETRINFRSRSVNDERTMGKYGP